MNKLYFILIIILFGITACGQQVCSDDAILLDISTSEDFLTKFPKYRTIYFNDAGYGNSLSANTNLKRNQKNEKEPIIKITNNNKIITKAQLEKIDPTTIKSIDVYPDTVFITLRDKTKSQDQGIR